MNQKLKKKIILNIPYVAIGLFATNLGEAWRIAEESSPNLCVKYFFPGTSCAGDANASMSVHYHS